MRRLPFVFLFAAWLAAGCGDQANSRYCDESTRCSSEAYPYCWLPWHECESTEVPDAGVPVPDAGCASGTHACPGGCLPDDDAAHCGAGCVACGGTTPVCSAGICSCTPSSCPAGEVCAGGSCVSGTCAAAADCTAPPACRTAAGATCNSNHHCEYPVAADGGSTQTDCTTSYSYVGGDPLFVDSPNDDYHLCTDNVAPCTDRSPCIDAGDPTSAPAVDLDGHPRTGTPDIGCYEAQ